MIRIFFLIKNRFAIAAITAKMKRSYL